MEYITKEQVIFPEQGWYVYNPCYVLISGVTPHQTVEASVTIGSQTIKSVIVGDNKNQGKIEISGLLRLLWSKEDFSNLSSVNTIKHDTIVVKVGGNTVTMANCFDLVYGSLNIDECFMSWGNTFRFKEYQNVVCKYQTRVAKWYSNLPCELSFVQMAVQREGQSTIKASVTAEIKNGTDWVRLEGSWATQSTIVHKIGNTDPRLSKGGIVKITTSLSNAPKSYQNFIVDYYYYEDKATDGYYLRWLDNNGLVNYYLFDKGKVTTKVKSIDTIEREVCDNNVYYPVANIDIEREVETTYKCSATCLDDELYNTVKTVVRANHVQMYLGKTYTDNATGMRDVWMPVRIAASQETENEAPRMKSLEINIVVPLYHSQSI